VGAPCSASDTDVELHGTSSNYSPLPATKMFGCLVAGRVVQTNLQQVDETHALFELPNASTINHICVFLLGTVPFPEGYGATVHFHWPGKGFQQLGMLSNDKPSAIFRLRGTYTSAISASPAHAAFSNTGSQPNAAADVTATLGISIEPLDQIIAQSSGTIAVATVHASNTAVDPSVIAERVVKHLFNYVSSFIGGVVGQDTMVPMSAIAKWYETFINKIRLRGAGFLEQEE